MEHDSPPDLALVAAEIYRRLCRIRPQFDPAELALVAELAATFAELKRLAPILIGLSDDLATADGLARFGRLAGVRDQLQARAVTIATALRLTQQARFSARSPELVPGPCGPKPWSSNP